MKEISQKAKDETVIVKQAEINKGLKFVGSQRIRRGHIMFQYNLISGELTEAEIEAEVIADTTGYKTKRKIITQENCQYFSCLNRTNAIRKLKQLGLWTTH